MNRKYYIVQWLHDVTLELHTHGVQHDAVLGVHSVLSLVPDHGASCSRRTQGSVLMEMHLKRQLQRMSPLLALTRLNNTVGALHATLRGQAVHEARLWPRRAHQILVHLRRARHSAASPWPPVPMQLGGEAYTAACLQPP